MAKFSPGDIVEHEDGSLYIVESLGDGYYVCATIYEANESFKASGSQYSPSLEVDNNGRLWKLGRIEI